LKSAQANNSRDPISKNPSQKTGLVEWLKVKDLSLGPSVARKKEKESLAPTHRKVVVDNSI
jgi:ribosomal protein S21